MTDIKENQSEKSTESISTRSVKPLIFISHDTRDAELAEAFSKLLSSVSAGVLKSFRSSDKRANQGIAYGVEWYPEIMKKLADASDVVALLTQHSVDRPWILYEAGVAKGKLDTPLLGIAIGIPLNKANNGPFAQFQNSSDDVDSLTKVVVQLVNRIPNSEPDTAVIKMQVEAFKKQATEILQSQPAVENKKDELMEDSSIAKLFEEVKIMFQDLPSRIDSNLADNGPKRFRRFHPMIWDDIMHITEDQNLGLLMVLSSLKNDIPWIYDLGVETLKKIKEAKNIKDKEIAVMDFEKIIEMSIHNPYFEEMMMRNKENYRMLRELPHFLEKALRRMIKPNEKD